MIVALSPYHLTTREAPAMASLQLAEHVVTLLPSAPIDEIVDERAGFEQAVRTIPRYHELLDAWRWCETLWAEGVVASTLDGADPAADVQDQMRRLSMGERPELAPLIEHGLENDGWGMLGSVAKDLMRGGPDPAISLPVAAGLDAFASRHNLVAARSRAASMAQKIEEQLATKVASFAVPILAQAGGDRIAEARDLLAPELDVLRAEMVAAIAGEEADILDAAHAYTAAFERDREHLVRTDDELDERTIARTVSVSLVSLPADCVLRSAVQAAQRVRLTGAKSTPGLLRADRVVGMIVRLID